MNARTTIIIPNYNGLKFLEPCLESLKQQTIRDVKILVVDNGSTDGSAEWLKDNHVPSIFLETNTGFDGAVNAGIKASDTPYVFLLNNDTTIDARCVEYLEAYMARSEKVFSVSARMIQMHAPKLMDDAGDMYSILGWAYQRGVGQPICRYERPCRVFSASAGAALYRREVFSEIGLFDELHFAYLEDVDIGYRAKLYGYDNIYCPEALVYHVGSGTSAEGAKYSAFKVRLAARNNIYLNYKNMRPWQKVINAPFLFLGYSVKFIYFVKKGFGKAYIKGLMEGIRTRKKCRKVPAGASTFLREIGIQMELYFGTAVYVYELLRRKISKTPDFR